MFVIIDADADDILGFASCFDVAVNYAQCCSSILRTDVLVCDDCLEVVYAVRDL